MSLRQRIVPDHLLGRVNAGYRLLAWGTMPLGAALAGFIGDRWGLIAVFWTSAALSALCFPIVYVVVTDKALAAAEPHHEVDDRGALTARSPRRFCPDERGGPYR